MNSGLLYILFRPFTRITLAAYFRKIHIAHKDRIPRKGPLIIACNHPNSFAEPCILACYQPRILHFLVRGDVFKQPVIAWLLRQTNQIPIYRFRDGFSSLKKNDKSFEACYNKLAKNAAILIFSEGNSLMEKRLRPIQKGTARLAFGAYENKGISEDFHILPMGVNYTHADRFRSEVMINFGHPIRVSDYIEKYNVHPQEAINALTADIQTAMQGLVLHIKDKKRDGLYDDLMDLIDADNPYPAWPAVEPTPGRYVRERKLLKWVNESEDQKILEVSRKMEELKRLLEPNKWSLLDLQYLTPPSFKTYLWYFPGLMFALPGILMNMIPFILSILSGIPFMRNIEFYTPVRMGTLMFAALLQNGMLSLYALTHQQWWLLLVAFFASFLGWFSVLFFEKTRGLRKYRSLQKNTNREKIIQLKDEILSATGF